MSEIKHTKPPYRKTDELYIWATGPNGQEFPIADIRGWGYLTGVGGLNLSDDDAAAIQDTNAEFIVLACNSHARLVAENEAMRVALQAVVADLFYQVEAKHGPKVASEYPSIVAARELITPQS